MTGDRIRLPKRRCSMSLTTSKRRGGTRARETFVYNGSPGFGGPYCAHGAFGPRRIVTDHPSYRIPPHFPPSAPLFADQQWVVELAMMRLILS